MKINFNALRRGIFFVQQEYKVNKYKRSNQSNSLFRQTRSCDVIMLKKAVFESLMLWILWYCFCTTCFKICDISNTLSLKLLMSTPVLYFSTWLYLRRLGQFHETLQAVDLTRIVLDGYQRVVCLFVINRWDSCSNFALLHAIGLSWDILFRSTVHGLCFSRTSRCYAPLRRCRRCLNGETVTWSSCYFNFFGCYDQPIFMDLLKGFATVVICLPS